MTNETNEVTGYVPSAEAVEAGTDAAINHQRVPTFQGPMSNCCGGCDHLYGTSDGANSPRHARHQITAALSAAVPVEVARLLGEVRALADRVDAEAHTICPEGVYDKTDKAWRSAAARRRVTRELRAVLDTVGVPAQVDEAATGGQS